MQAIYADGPHYAHHGAIEFSHQRQAGEETLVGGCLLRIAGRRLKKAPVHIATYYEVVCPLPTISLLGAHAIVAGASLITGRLRLSPRVGTLVVLLGLLLVVSAQPAYQVVLTDIRQSRPSTMVLARKWIVVHLPHGCSIAQEAYTAPLGDTDFAILELFALAEHPIEYYLSEGYQYLVISRAIYDRYFVEPHRYAKEIAFYRNLIDEGSLLAKFEPSLTTGGPVIQVFELNGR